VKYSFLLIGVILAGLLLALPLFMVLWQGLQPSTAVLSWQVIEGATTTSMLLMGGSGVIAVLLGTVTAWLVSMTVFKGKKILEAMLVLPLAMPAYLLAYTYSDFLDVGGTTATFLRGMGIAAPQIHSVYGAMGILGVAFYPYIYLLAAAAFQKQSATVLETAQSLGHGGMSVFWRLSLPLARPAIMAGLALVLMETLADFGTVSYLGVETFTTTIYRSWFGQNSPEMAARLAGMLLCFVVVLIFWEEKARQKQHFYASGTVPKPLRVMPLRGFKAVGAGVVCGLPVVLGFLLPCVILAQQVWESASRESVLAVMPFVKNSVLVASVAALVSVFFALVLGITQRVQPHPALSFVIRFASVGYAIPGAVIGLGILLVVTKLAATPFYGWLYASGIALLYAYTVRFLSLSSQTMQAGLQKIKPALEEAARTLGASRRRVLWAIQLPLLRKDIAVAMILVFVDALKELPATLLLRPFNFDTLAVKVHALAADERLDEAALPALVMVLISLGMVAVLQKLTATKNAP
jgi:iron(III) transport system permease protein